MLANEQFVTRLVSCPIIHKLLGIVHEEQKVANPIHGINHSSVDECSQNKPRLSAGQ